MLIVCKRRDVFIMEWLAKMRNKPDAGNDGHEIA